MKTKWSSILKPSLIYGAGILTVGAVIVVSTGRAHACDSCNYHFQSEVLTERANTLAGRDVLRAMENQAGLPIDGFGTVRHGTPAEMRAFLFGESAAEAAEAAEAVPADPPAEESEVVTSARDSAEAAVAALQANNRGVAYTGVAQAAPVAAPVSAATAAEATSWAEKHGIEALYGENDFIEIIERDYSLPVPPTSYVPQDSEPDVSFSITLNEGSVYLGNGVVYEGFLIDGKIPGPTLIVEEGDIVEFTVVNDGAVPHGASIHAAYTQTSKYVGNILPGESKTVLFRATVPGVYMYHCAPGGHAIPVHVLAGQYGMMVVKPKEKKYKMEELLGRGPDVEIYLTQHEWYASGKEALEGKARYTSFNGKLFRYIEEPIVAKPGDYVRINFLNVGPNLLSTFHLVGIVWDYVYWQGHPDAVLPGGQTVTAGPSDSFVIEFRVPPDEGTYLMLSHAVGSTSRGAIGALVADKDAETPLVVMSDGPLHTEEEMEEIKASAVRTISPFGIGSEDVDRPAVYGPETKEAHVEIIGNSYYPKIIQVAAGTTVTWTNEEAFTYLAGEFSGIHNAVAISGPERFASPLLAHAERFSHTFTEVGEYDYICTPHPYMKGRVIVTEAQPVVVAHNAHPPVAEVEEPAEEPAVEVDEEDVVSEVTITGDDQMRFEPTLFKVEAGSEVTLHFKNIGVLPKEAMGHNLAVLVAGADIQAFATAAMRHAAEEYIAPEMADQVVAATKILGPGEEETLVFTAPDVPGDYPFVCSFPGHTPVGMTGVMRVVE